MGRFALKNISKSFGDQHILKDVTIEAEDGEFIALVGPSGCGKSTILRIAAGLEHADDGAIWLDGRNITAAHPSDRNIAMVFQSYALYPHLTTRENIAVPLAMRDLTVMERLPLIGNFLPGQAAKRAAIQQQVQATALSLKIDHLLDRKPAQMSGGQRQRVALARAMVRQPQVFLMDEPLSNLDANLRVHTRAEIVDLHRRAGVPSLYVTHDQSEALSMADRVAVMIGGHLLQIDTPAEIYNNPRHIEVARFIGSPKINVLNSRASDQGIIHFAGKPILSNVDIHAGSAVSVAIRPEDLQIRKITDQTAERVIFATVARVEFLGSEALIYLNAPGAQELLTARTTPAHAADLQPDMPVHLTFEPQKALLFDTEGQRLRKLSHAAVSRIKADSHV
ncbi:ABC transporter ATP-binding protein [Pseudochrobactrum sp. sp1633]|uniref:ABC transporter ATP-binding protein n=1 Tax=Pseudochrobactrum sp. sp1633 TaxID=3036706 RepID=UPI0025A5C021|nr:ABC transporter ATP-binding protein [Pseudochrobactrum sp. sp1633]MDM8345102.1 ABC transporter ATP-binding protein [Pseudochrobactrum sp. sp1633]HWD14935.1 ABC transporter ATP-binding protein [Pseudochrobactrum sp.]